MIYNLSGDNVLPGFAKDHATNHAMDNAELVTQFNLPVASGSVQPSNLPHVILCQLGYCDPLPSGHPFGMKMGSVLITASQALGMSLRSVSITRCLSAFRVAVRVIIGVRSQPEMMGIAADWVVAGMADKNVISDRAIGQHVGKSMGPPLLAVQLERAVPRVKNRAGEGPALSNGAVLNFRVEMSRGIMEGHSNHPQTMIGVPCPRTFAASRGFRLSINYTRSGTPLLAAVA